MFRGGEGKTVHIDEAFTAIVEVVVDEKSGCWSIKVLITLARYHLTVEIEPPSITLNVIDFKLLYIKFV